MELTGSAFREGSRLSYQAPLPGGINAVVARQRKVSPHRYLVSRTLAKIADFVILVMAASVDDLNFIQFLHTPVYQIPTAGASPPLGGEKSPSRATERRQ